MGWKTVKERYKIVHNVHVEDGMILISSSYYTGIIKIRMDGTFEKRNDSYNEDLVRYQKEFDMDANALKDAILSEDTFEESIAVYTYSDGEIIEKKCESVGWPNVTHDGELMYDNSFSPNYEHVVGWCKKDARLAVEDYAKMLAEKEKEVERFRQKLNDCIEFKKKADKL